MQIETFLTQLIATLNEHGKLPAHARISIDLKFSQDGPGEIRDAKVVVDGVEIDLSGMQPHP